MRGPDIGITDGHRRNTKGARRYLVKRYAKAPKGKSLQDIEISLQTQFNLIVDWMRNNDMYINVSKTKVMLFGSRNKVQGEK